MLIVCNRPGGFGFFGLRLIHGENAVDDAVWQAVAAKLDPRMLIALTSAIGSQAPDLILHDGIRAPAPALPRAHAPTLAPAPARIADADLTAKEKIALVEAATTYDQLDALELNETRKTVLQAIYRRAEQIDNGEVG